MLKKDNVTPIKDKISLDKATAREIVTRTLEGISVLKRMSPESFKNEEVYFEEIVTRFSDLAKEARRV